MVGTATLDSFASHLLAITSHLLTTWPSQWLFYFCVISVEPHIGPWVWQSRTEQWSNKQQWLHLFVLFNSIWKPFPGVPSVIRWFFLQVCSSSSGSDRSRNVSSRASWTQELETIDRDKPEARERNTSVILFEKVTKVLFWRFYTIYRQLIKWPSSQPSINLSPATPCDTLKVSFKINDQIDWNRFDVMETL